MSKSSVLVLIVDDEQVDSTVMRRALEVAGGFRVLEESTIDGALRRFVENLDEIGLVICDVSLPGGNGVDLVRSMLRERANLKFLFTSGWVGAESLRAFGIFDTDRRFLGKPFRPAQLIERVRAILAVDQGTEPSLNEDDGLGEAADGS